MCGIIHVIRHDGKPAARSVRKRYFKQKARGSDGFGYLAIKDNELVSYERSTTEHGILQKLEKETAPEILFHHRFPTSGPNVEEMAHPIRVGYKQENRNYFIVHNGVIRNAKERHDEHKELGYSYATELKNSLKSVLSGRVYLDSGSLFNDSEALAIDTVLSIEEGKLIKAQGASAVIGIMVEGTTVKDRFFYRNSGNPLYLRQDRTMTTLTSGFCSGAKEVPNAYIMQFTEDFKMEIHPSKQITPWVYMTTSYYGGEYGKHREPILDSNVVLLPPKKEPVDLTEGGVSIGEKTPPMGISSWEDIEATAMDVEEEYRMATLIETFKEEVLWEEYRTTTQVMLDLETTLEKLDERVNAGEFVPNQAIFESRKKLDNRRARTLGYQKLLEGEMNRRSKLETSLERVIQL